MFASSGKQFETKDMTHGMMINILINIALALATSMFALAISIAFLGVTLQMNRTTERRLAALEGLVAVYKERAELPQ